MSIDLNDYLEYNALTGVITWHNPHPNNGIVAGSEAGCVNKRGYRQINFRGKTYFSHRVGWFLYYGKWPEGILDHRNRDKLDNRIENLRVVSYRENNQNTDTFKGASYNKKLDKWQSRIYIRGKRIHLGYFDTMKEARDQYFEYVEREMSERRNG